MVFECNFSSLEQGAASLFFNSLNFFSEFLELLFFADVCSSLCLPLWRASSGILLYSLFMAWACPSAWAITLCCHFFRSVAALAHSLAMRCCFGCWHVSYLPFVFHPIRFPTMGNDLLFKSCKACCDLIIT